MPIKNSELDKALQKGIKGFEDFGAYALGIDQEIPFFALKLPQSFAADMDKPLSCEFKPAMLNITYDTQTFAMCIVQFRLNGDDRLVFSMYFDLMQQKEFKIAKALLKMQEYGIMLVTKETHRVMEFKANFVGTFSPIIVLEETLKKADSHDKALCQKIYSGIVAQTESASHMWYLFERIAPAHHRWYAKM